MDSSTQPKSLRLLSAIYRLMLSAYPPTFRREFGHEMYVTVRTEAQAIYRSGRSADLARFAFRIGRDWAITLFKEYVDMPKRIFSMVLVLLLLVVDWLTFHDVFEPHTVRDYLSLAASLLVFFYMGRDRLDRDIPSHS